MPKVQQAFCLQKKLAYVRKRKTGVNLSLISFFNSVTSEKVIVMATPSFKMNDLA